MNQRHDLQIRRRIGRWLLLGAALGILALTGAACGSPEGPPGAVHVLKADGTVNPVLARFIGRAIDNAESEDANAVVIELDTPGGLSSSMDDIVKDILRAEVPIIVYVSPSGGRAASAGTFITLAGHVAAMAPGTSIGAANGQMRIQASDDEIEADMLERA